MLAVVRVWILLSALFVAAGWVLSLFHQLNRIGYGVILTLAGIAAICWWQNNNWSVRSDLWRVLRRLWQRFKRPAPLLFLTLALMALVGGALYVHTNGASSTYRIPRVLHWLEREQWHWIDTEDKRANVVACGFEWLSAPLILFTGTDRLLFLINWISYLMFPGLIFGVFKQLQIRPRVAWWWMWLLSSCWCFALQASSDVNDSFAAIYALAAVYFALRARESNRVADLWLSMLAAALLTGVKQTNIPLMLLWLVAAWLSIRLLFARPVATVFIVTASLLVSVVPITIFNIEHCGNWQGLAPGEAEFWSAGSPFWKIVGNVFSIPLQNLLPLYFPWSGAWDRMMLQFLQTPFGAHFVPFERFGHLGMGVSEWNAGIGLGICILALVSLVGAHYFKQRVLTDKTPLLRNVPWWLRVTPWILLLVFMAEICSDENARLLSAYYVFLFPLLLVGSGQECLVRRLWWQRLGLSVMLLTVAMLLFARERPLFPAKTIIGQLQSKYPHSKFLSMVWSHYALPSSIASLRDHFKNGLPRDQRIIGYAIMTGFPETALRLSSGKQRVERVLLKDTLEQLRLRDIHYVLVEDIALEASKLTIEEWTQKTNGSVVDQITFVKDPYRPPGHLYFVCFRSNTIAPRK